MESIISIVNLVLQDVSSRKILNGVIDYDHFSKEQFIALYNQKSDSMSGNDVEQLYYYLLTLVEPEPALSDQYHTSRIFERQGFSVLSLIKEYTNRVLEQMKGVPICKYRRLLSWRMVTSKLDEDLFTTAFLATQDINKSWSKRTDFDWKTVIGHDNYELNNLLKKGVVENHYHLKGSAPYFALTWLNLMNDIGNEQFVKCLKEFDDNRLTKSIYPTWDGYEPSYTEMHLQAALIRCFLFCRLTHRPFGVFNQYTMKTDDMDYYINWPEETEELSEEDVIHIFEHLEDTVQTRVGYQELMSQIFRYKGWNNQGNSFWKEFMNCISKKHSLEISYVREKIMSEKLYGLRAISLLFLQRIKQINISAESVYILLYPDRQERFLGQKNFDMVYHYLTVPDTIYEIRDSLDSFIKEMNYYNQGAESRQKGIVTYDYVSYNYTNDVGYFHNVSHTERWFLYQMFLKLYGGDMEYQMLGNMFYAYLVIKGRIRAELVQVNNKTGFDNFLKYQNRKEYFIDNTRYETVYSYIALADTWHYQKDMLVGLEARICPKDTAEANQKTVANILMALSRIEEGKNKTYLVFHFVKEPDLELTSGKQQCRHYKKRIEIRQKAIAIEEFRRNYPKEASVVYGIDACSPEIGCRPEVFAQAFTYLRGMQMSANVHGKGVPRLGISYHVGEDFLDIVDGLRAIDEAIHFLQMDSGDRLGHALALGVSPVEWYQFKGRRVLLTKQDHLDNIVWIYMKIRKYNIHHSESMLQELQREYVHCFQEIYGTNIDCDINVYYDAWKLRGDNPEMYMEERFEEAYTEWDYFAKNDCYRENKKIRRQELCRQLYLIYHYDEEVKKRGAEVVECKVSRELMEVTEQIQRCLQKEIAGMGISVESNPSSNYMIGTFNRYDQHPIKNFYNKGLTADYKELMDNPQIDVTINTDDQAVFATSLENEYAYIALAMEKLRDEKGKNVYCRSMIYEWLNNIRRNSKKVCFLQNLDYGTQRAAIGISEDDEENE